MAQERTGEIVDLHREVSIGLLKSVRCFCVRTPKGQKDPGHLGWDPRTNNLETHKQNITRLERGDDNLGIHLFGNTVDVDVDNDNPFVAEALDYFLPPTPHVWGRGDRKKTHRLYELSGLPNKDFDPNDYPFLQVVAKHEAIKMEVRGGAQRSGRYTLLPGSMHPSGDAYQWHDVSAAKSTPVSVDVYKVIDNIRFALVTAMIAPYWNEGVRNDLCMALSGFMYRAAKHVEDMGAQSSIYFTKKEAQQLLEGIMHVADDDEADRQMRLRTFEQTWKKSENGEATTGGATLSRLLEDPDAVSLLYILLADTPDLVALDEFFDRFAVRNNTSNIIDIEAAGAKNVSFIMTVNDFRNSNMHKTITSGTGARVQMTNILLASPRATRVDGLAFRPNGDRIIEENGVTFINQWRGWAIPPAEEAKRSEVKPFIDYVNEILASSDPIHYNWIMGWIADIFQNPGRKLGTALVLVGKPGAGKSFLGENIVRKIIGFDHSMQTNTLESITGNFNADSGGMLFVQCDEAANTRRRADANRMKSLITDHTKRIEPKGINAYQIEDFCRYLMTSNEVTDAVAIVDGRYDRRYAVFQVNEAYSFAGEKGKDEKRRYWDELGAWCANKENLAKVHRFLLDFEIDESLVRTPPDTKARRVIQQHSMRGMEDWLMNLATSEHPFDTLPPQKAQLRSAFVRNGTKWENDLSRWPDALPYSVLVDSYENYRRRKGVVATTSTYNEQQMKQEFITRGMLPFKHFTGKLTYKYEEWQDGQAHIVNKRVRVSQFPTKEAIEAYLERAVGFVADDDDAEEMYVGVEEERDPDVDF